MSTTITFTATDCTVDSYTKLISELIQVLLLFVSLGVTTLEAILKGELEDIGKAINYGYDFLTGFGSWIGYGFAGVYFFGKEYGFGDIFCEITGYLTYVVDALYFLIDWSGISEENSA